MYSTILTVHSLFRWLVLLSLCYSLFRAYRGYVHKKKFTLIDNKLRHWTATIAHVQLVLGILVYIKSPLIEYFFSDFKALFSNWDYTFFGIFHFGLMCIAIICITIGSAKAKRSKTDSEKFKIMLVWFSVGLLLIFVAIPWPFSPLANRPYLRTL